MNKMYKIVYTSRIKKDIKLFKRQGKNRQAFDDIITKIGNREPLEEKHRNHILSGNWEGCYECHIQPDWLLIYDVNEEDKTITLFRTGSHANLLENVADFVYINQKLQEILQEE